MATETIDPAQLEQLLEALLLEQTVALGHPHLRQIQEHQVASYQIDDSLLLATRKPQALADLLGHLGTEFIMAMKADAIRSLLEGVGFSDVVEQRSHRQFKRRILQMRKHQAGVNEHIPFWMMLRWLLNPTHPFDLGQDVLHQAAVGEQVITSLTVW